MKLLSVFLIGTAIGFAAPGPKLEVGELNGARFRIDIPENWNGGLVVYCHGYAADPVKYKEDKLPALFAVFTDQGYALAQSGYAAGGWAIEEAVNDTEALRRYFTTKYGKPKETYVTGHSMGGFLTMMLMERFPTTYDAGLAMCGPLAPTNYFMSRGAFDARVVFDYYFPGVLPAPDKVPAGNPSISASAPSIRRSAVSIAAFCFKSSFSTARLRRVNSCSSSMGTPRSTAATRSIRRTVAPMSASSIAAIGAGPMPVNSTIFTPAKGPIARSSVVGTLFSRRADWATPTAEPGGRRLGITD